MTPETLAKIRAIANDSRGDPATRAAARMKLEAWESLQPKQLHPGRRQSPEYRAWAEEMKNGFHR